ncbi:MAG TPA: SMP-30/gluconolactonase/LRE family protein, partial [Bryobacteraceae bacterium]|nr:SMP-30/gluconolactonase/LRE family protein [Bryobacteraceae bacterium]
LYACQNTRKRIVAYDKEGNEAVVAEGLGSNDLVITAKGDMYVTEPNAKKVWFIDAKGNKRVVHEGKMEFANGVMLSPDQSLLTVSDSRGRWVWSFQIQPDGSLDNGEPFYHLETSDESSATTADGMAMDTEGHLYVTTAIGLQICDQPGRVVAILEKPAARLSNVKFGGPDMKTLYVTAGDKVFKRRVRRTGASHLVVSKPPRPRL